jgi:ribosomal protein L11 methyltransferase
MRWLEIRIEATDASADAATEILILEGCGGTAASRPSGCVRPDAMDVFAYLPLSDRIEDSLARIRDAVRALPNCGLELRSDEIIVTWIEDDDWATAWRKYFKPIRIGRIVVKPSWEEFEPGPGDVVVELDPGMAFGTGNHESTRLCLLTLQDYVKGGEVVLDVGTGSGILAMAAAKLGAAEVMGIDNDMIAVDAAVENVARSGLGKIVRIELGDSPNRLRGSADVVVANIVPDVIIPMARDLSGKTKPGGIVITSGIVCERADEVRASLESAGLATHETRMDRNWVVIVSRKPQE